MSLYTPSSEMMTDVDSSVATGTEVNTNLVGIDVDTAFAILSRRTNTSNVPSILENENPSDFDITTLQQNFNGISLRGGCGCSCPEDQGVPSQQVSPTGQSIDVGTTHLDHDNVSRDASHHSANAEILDSQKMLLQSQQQAVEKQEQLSSTIHSMSINEILSAIFHTQEERVKCYRFFDEGVAYVTETGNSDYYPLICADVTATFTVLSSTINAIRSDLQNRSSIDPVREIVALINRLQCTEQTKLQLTAALHLEMLRIQAQQQPSETQSANAEDDHIEIDVEIPLNLDDQTTTTTEHQDRIASLLEESINTLRKKIAVTIVEINDVLEELRYCTALDETDKDKATMISLPGGTESWVRVAMGMEKVVIAMAAQNRQPTHMIPSTSHFPELLSSLQVALQQAMHESMKQAGATTTKAAHNPPESTPSASPPSVSKRTTSVTNTTPMSTTLTVSLVQSHTTTPNQAYPEVAKVDVARTQSTSTTTLPPTSSTRSLNDMSSGDVIDTMDMPKNNDHKVDHEKTRIKEGAAVPSTRAGRALGFANLGFGLLMGTVAESARRLVQPSSSQSSSVVLNDRNSDRLAASLCRMRGAALKMGQMLSIQDESLLPPPLVRALQQVRQGADAMPRSQLEQQLISQLGSNWRTKFIDFDMNAFAAASIGQVHRATIRDNRDMVLPVVVKVQYPGVAQSIESDLRNLAMMVTWSGLAPKGLFIENVIRVGRDELKAECNYRRELQNQLRVKVLVESDPILQENKFRVPFPIEELTTDEVITGEYVAGGTIDKMYVDASQHERNRIGHTLLYLTMKEIFDWRFMQTDPNWGNFLYDVNTRTTGLIDFGATREYSKDFVDGYLRIVWASAIRDEKTLMEQSHAMGFLTGDENDIMLRAHKLSGYTVGEPFNKDAPFDFRSSRISERMGEHTSVFLQHRLTAPPEEVYTLHRKLAGAYMLCIKLGSIVDSPRRLLESLVANHTFDDGKPHPLNGR